MTTRIVIISYPLFWSSLQSYNVYRSYYSSFFYNIMIYYNLYLFSCIKLFTSSPGNVSHYLSTQYSFFQLNSTVTLHNFTFFRTLINDLIIQVIWFYSSPSILEKDPLCVFTDVTSNVWLHALGFKYNNYFFIHHFLSPIIRLI